ncbi:ABC transporter ATP-binding protein [Ruminococcaceae bacterium OttesenSCG-928-A11]|nr:ABC transporter ATP-binding protein [Ruminococcaceae bacterium OttesenSCG-928-A11]
MGENKIALEVREMSVRFGGLLANDSVSFKVEEGAFYGLIGPNGAGKTTVFNTITGSVAPTEGDILFCGDSLLKKRPDQIAAMGISRTFQNIRLFSQMTAQENVEIGMHTRPKYSRLSAALGLPIVRRTEREVRQKAAELLERLNLLPYQDMKAGNLPYGIQRKLEIARALATQPRLLLLDEPAAGMNNDECGELVNLLTRIHKDFGLTIVLIEHHMDVVVELCDRICVLNLGKVLTEDAPRQVQDDPRVIAAYLGNRRQVIEDGE